MYSKGKSQGDSWASRKNRERYELYGEAVILCEIKKLELGGHTIRMEENIVYRRLLDTKLGANWKVGRPKLW